MGQYYRLVSIDSREHTYTGGDKMIEILWDGSSPSLAILLLDLSKLIPESALIKNKISTWAGERVLFVGDYCREAPRFLTKEEAKIVNKHIPDGHTGENICKFGNWVNEFPQAKVRRIKPEYFPKGDQSHHLILNLTRKEYLDPAGIPGEPTSVVKFAESDKGIIRALMSCLFYANEVAGGDLKDYVEGRWAGERIVIRERDEVEDLEVEGKWIDITEEVVDELGDYMD